MDNAKFIEELMAKGWKEQTNVEGDMFDFKNEKEPRLVGILTGIKENTGQDGNSTLYGFETEDKKKVVFWGGAVLDGRLSQDDIDNSVEMAILYMGMETGKTGRRYHNYKIFKNKIPTE